MKILEAQLESTMTMRAASGTSWVMNTGLPLSGELSWWGTQASEGHLVWFSGSWYVQPAGCGMWVHVGVVYLSGMHVHVCM